MTQIIALIKTLLMKDADPAELNKPWWQRRRTMQKIVAVIGALLYFKWGLVLDSDAQNVITDNYEVIVNSLSAAFAAAMTLYGIIGAIVGQRGATKKLTTALKDCQNPPKQTTAIMQDGITQFPTPTTEPWKGTDLPESPKNP